MDALPLVLVAPPGPARDRFLAQLPPGAVEVLDAPGAFHPPDEGAGVALLLGPGTPPGEILRLLRGAPGAPLPRAPLPWVPLLVEEEAEGGFVVRSLSLGPPLSLPEVLAKLERPGEEGPILELYSVLRFVARARHDLNNPLTSGLAETQLLLMDPQPEELRESLETIQEQFRRLRDMVAELAQLRLPQRR